MDITLLQYFLVLVLFRLPDMHQSYANQHHHYYYLKQQSPKQKYRDSVEIIIINEEF